MPTEDGQEEQKGPEGFLVIPSSSPNGEQTSNPNEAPGNDNFDEDTPETATEGEQSDDTSDNESDSSDQEEAPATALTVPCQVGTGFTSIHLNSLDNVGIYQHCGVRLNPDEHFNAKFLMNALEEIKSLPNREVSSAVATANTLGFFTGHLKRTDTLESVTKDALEKLNDTALEKLARFKVAFTLQSHAILCLKTVMALDRIKDQYGEMKPLAFQGTKYNRMGRLISRLEKAVQSLRQSLTKPDTLYYGDIEDLIDLLKNEELLKNDLDILVQEKEWVEDKISEYLGGFKEADDNEDEDVH
ncbi:hypothetical protein OESDEN_10793 [Oesophagostomum dentatum]|uniref:Uncharacterized protein n=1 Tax=Oesophagostomum dentatum TaxID=61180 RepID=A0A0B1T0T3_OESDE|nr:hypothetical protein OESDEN_10793 [Oesophagostomum dentatum]